jgi:hypothetical protein
LNEDYKHAFLQAIDSYVNKAHYIIEHEYKASIKETKRSNFNITSVVPAEIKLKNILGDDFWELTDNDFSSALGQATGENTRKFNTLLMTIHANMTGLMHRLEPFKINAKTIRAFNIEGEESVKIEVEDYDIHVLSESEDV